MSKPKEIACPWGKLLKPSKTQKAQGFLSQSHLNHLTCPMRKADISQGTAVGYYKRGGGASHYSYARYSRLPGENNPAPGTKSVAVQIAGGF